jgi:hypothetical protein
METTTQGLEEEVTATPGSAAKLIREVRAKVFSRRQDQDCIGGIPQGDACFRSLPERREISSV